MNKKVFYCLFLCLVLIILSSGINPINVPIKTDTIPTGDTASFEPNINGGWDILSSYMNLETDDSVQLEIVLLKQSSTDWRSEHLIGSIVNQAFMPKRGQRLTYILLPEDVWYIRVNPNGQCFLSQVKGPPLKASSLTGNPFLLPLKVRYKIN